MVSVADRLMVAFFVSPLAWIVQFLGVSLWSWRWYGFLAACGLGVLSIVALLVVDFAVIGILRLFLKQRMANWPLAISRTISIAILFWLVLQQDPRLVWPFVFAAAIDLVGAVLFKRINRIGQIMSAV